MRSNAWPERALAVVVACSLEAAGIQLAYVTVQALAGRAIVIPLVGFAVAVLAGLVLARWSVRHPRVPYRLALAGLAAGAAAIGWLVPLGAAAARLVEAPMATLQLQFAGLLLGVAVLRGAAHVTPDDDGRIARRALGPGLALVGCAWLLLTAAGANRQPAVVEVAFAATVTYVTAALLSVGLARLADPDTGGLTADRRRTWTGLLVGVVAALLVVSVPLALVARVPVDAALRGVLGPVAEVAIFAGALVVIPLGLLGAILVQVATFVRDTLDIGNPGGVIGQLSDQLRRLVGSATEDGRGLGVLPAVVALLLAVFVLRRLIRRPEVVLAGSDVAETRVRERPTLASGLRRPRLRGPRRSGDPRSATEAYLASLEVLGRSDASARLEAETPSEHARRLRGDPVGPALGRLAADYVLAEFAGRTLAAAEHRRAIERWRRIRAATGR